MIDLKRIVQFLKKLFEPPARTTEEARPCSGRKGPTVSEAMASQFIPKLQESSGGHGHACLQGERKA